MARKMKLDWLQPAVLTGSLIPFAVLAFRAFTGRLGANPIATMLNQLGLLALLFVFASLSCTSLKIVFGWKWTLKLRKTLGLLGFFTVLAHLLLYAVVDQQLRLSVVLEDVLKRPFIAVGFGAFLLLLPLALTSTKKALKRMGPKNWRRLHRLAYVIGILGVVHFYMRQKQDTTEPIIYGFVLCWLLGVRLVYWWRQRRHAAQRP